MELEERLLEAWLDISTAINNDRLVKDLTYGEALVCHFIYLHGSKETLSSLCEKTGILKSQMNRILGNLEKKALIKKERSTEDKRDIFILPSDDKTFYDQHADILKIVSKITKRLGTKKSIEAIDILHEIAKIAKEEL